MFPDRNPGLWRPHAAAGEKREEKGASERSWYVLTVPLTIPHPPVAPQGR